MIYTHSLLYGVSYLKNSSQASTLFSRDFPDYVLLKMALILPCHKYFYRISHTSVTGVIVQGMDKNKTLLKLFIIHVKK